MKSCGLSSIAAYLKVGRQLIFDCNYTFDAIFTETNITKLANFEIGKQTQFNFFLRWQFFT